MLNLAFKVSLKSISDFSFPLWIWFYPCILSSSHVCGGVRWFLDGMSIGLQIRCTMVTWLSFRVKRRSFFQRQWRVLLMLISSIQTSHLHLPKQIALSWHFEIGWDDTATASLSGLAWATNNLYHQQFYQNVRCEKLIVTDPLVISFSFFIKKKIRRARK